MRPLPVVFVVLGLLGAVGSCVRGTQQNIETASSVAGLVVPSAMDVMLEERTYALHYRDARPESLERSGKSTSLPVPPLTIEIDPPAGGTKPDKTLETAWDTTSLAGVYIRQIGVIDVHRAGRYTVRVASPKTGGTVCIGDPPTPAANIFVRAIGIFLAGVLLAVAFGKLARPRVKAD